MADDHDPIWGEKQPPRPPVEFDETSGEQSRELGGSYIREGEQGSNQFLRGNDHDDVPRFADDGNQVQAGSLPRHFIPTTNASDATKARPIGDQGKTEEES